MKILCAVTLLVGLCGCRMAHRETSRMGYTWDPKEYEGCTDIHLHLNQYQMVEKAECTAWK